MLQSWRVLLLGEDRCALVSSRRLLYSMRLEGSRRLEGSGRQLKFFVVWVGLRLEGSDRQMELFVVLTGLCLRIKFVGALLVFL
jgi:hypothetical protein